MDTYTKAKILLKAKGFVEMNIVGTSMLPLIKDGEKVHVIAHNNFEPFDILVFYFKPRDSFICHYFWTKSMIEPGNIITRPLNNPKSGYDIPVNEEYIIGKVTNFKIGFFRKLLILLTKK